MREYCLIRVGRNDLFNLLLSGCQIAAVFQWTGKDVLSLSAKFINDPEVFIHFAIKAFFVKLFTNGKLTQLGKPITLVMAPFMICHVTNGIHWLAKFIYVRTCICNIRLSTALFIVSF